MGPSITRPSAELVQSLIPNRHWAEKTEQPTGFFREKKELPGY